MLSISKGSIIRAVIKGISSLKQPKTSFQPRGVLIQELSHHSHVAGQNLRWQSISAKRDGRDVPGHASSAGHANTDTGNHRSPGESFERGTGSATNFDPATLPPYVKTWLEDPKCYLDRNHIYRGKKSPATGHIKATYSTWWPPFTHSINWCLMISYDRNCVSDDEDLWLEVRAACEFARAITEGRKSLDGDGPGNLRPLEYIHIHSRFHYDLTRPEEPWHFACTVGKRRRWRGVRLRQGFHVYGKDHSLAKGYLGYRQILKKEDPHCMDPVLSISETSSGQMEVVATVSENDQIRDARHAILRAASTQAVLPPDETPILDEIETVLTERYVVDFDDMRRCLGEDGSGTRRSYEMFAPPFGVKRHLPAR